MHYLQFKQSVTPTDQQTAQEYYFCEYCVLAFTTRNRKIRHEFKFHGQVPKEVKKRDYVTPNIYGEEQMLVEQELLANVDHKQEIQELEPETLESCSNNQTKEHDKNDDLFKQQSRVFLDNDASRPSTLQVDSFSSNESTLPRIEKKNTTEVAMHPSSSSMSVVSSDCSELEGEGKAGQEISDMKVENENVMQSAPKYRSVKSKSKNKRKTERERKKINLSEAVSGEFREERDSELQILTERYHLKQLLIKLRPLRSCQLLSSTSSSEPTEIVSCKKKSIVSSLLHPNMNIEPLCLPNIEIIPCTIPLRLGEVDDYIAKENKSNKRKRKASPVSRPVKREISTPGVSESRYFLRSSKNKSCSSHSSKRTAI